MRPAHSRGSTMFHGRCRCRALVPTTSVALWIVGVAALVALRWRLRDAPPAKLERAAQAGIAVTAAYMIAMIGARNGRVTLANACHAVAPSIAAAS